MYSFVVDKEHTAQTLALFVGGLKPCGRRGERTEARMRETLRAIFGCEFPKSRPPWLRNPATRRPLELDMYNERLRLGFEYDGAQHTHYTPHYHANRDEFEYRRLLDRLKEQLCRENGVDLIRVPFTVQPSQVRAFLEGHCGSVPRLRALMRD